MKINILVAQHKKSYVINSNILKPITCGHYKDPNILSDSSGDNISELNDKYCELTAQYWAWKNMDSDYYGFFHYRRYISFNNQKKVKTYNYACMDDFFVNDCKLFDENIRKIIEQYDIIVPAPVKLYGIYKQYRYSPYLSIQDLDNIFNIVIKKYPYLKKTITQVKKSKKFYSCNIYIMKKNIFFEYCNWLFPILEEFNQTYNYEFKNLYSTRVIGLLAERLFNVYFYHIKKENKNLKVKVLPFSILENTDDPYPEPKKHDSVPVVLTCSDSYAKYAGLIIEEIIKNNKANKFYEIFLISNDISEIWCKRIESIGENYKNISIKIVNGNRFIKNNKFHESYKLSELTYLKLGTFDYLKNYKKVIYLDCNLVVNDDLINLFNIDLNNKVLGATVDMTFLSSYLDNESVELAHCKKIGIKNIWEYFNTSVLLIDIQKMNKIVFSQTLLNLCKNKKILFQDQDILNVLFQDKVKFIDLKWNCFSQDNFFAINAPLKFYNNYINACKNPSIVHYSKMNLPISNSHNSLLDIYFWKYARESMFYEEILKDIYPKKINKKSKKNRKLKSKIIKIFKNHPNILILLGSVYRFFWKK